MALTNNTRGPVYTYGYIDDTAKEWAVSLTEAVAYAGGFVALTAPASNLPKRAKMRHVGLFDPTSKKRERVPIAHIADGHYAGTEPTCNLDGITFNVTGRIGEKFPLSNKTPPV